MIFEIKMSIVKGPVQEGGTREKGRTILKGRENANDERIGGHGGENRLGEGEVKHVDNNWVGNDGEEVVIQRCINIILMGEGIGGAYQRAESNYPFNVEVLEK